jgi:molybdenum cofactor cytidylyltransferase
MTISLVDQLGIGPHELISIVGAGGKTTLLHTLGRELATSGHRVVLTSTTKMASDQITNPAVHGADPTLVDTSFVAGTPLFVVGGHHGGKADGLAPGDVDRLFAETTADYVITEADGARTKSIKAPADHEPVIPAATTIVIVVMGADALGQPISEVAHRPERIAELTGTDLDTLLTADLAATVLLHPEGGLKNIPTNARTVMVITKVPGHGDATIVTLARLLSIHPSVDTTVTLPTTSTVPLSRGTAEGRSPDAGG